MPLHFTREELAQRRERSCAALAERGLDGLLMFRQESMYYLTGYDTFGFVFFQCLYLGQDGAMALLTRLPDLRQAQQTSCVEDIRIWVNLPDANPAAELRALLDEKGCAGKRLGVEYDGYGLTAHNGRQLEAALHGFCRLEDASDLVTRQRVVKSESEIAYVRRAAELADQAFDEARALAHAGGDEGAILAAMQGAIFTGGGDYPANGFIVGSGEQALLCRYYSGRRVLDAQDQLTLEWAGTYRHYHAAMMWTIPIGAVPDKQAAMFDVAREALLAVEDALRPGNTYGQAFDAHARVMDARGHSGDRMQACGYSLGTTFAPNWMDWPMLYHDNPAVVQPGMTIFCHMIIFDSPNNLAMTLGRTSLITEAGAEPLSRTPLELVVG